MPRLSTSARSADRDLVKGLNEGDEAALAALYDEYAERTVSGIDIMMVMDFSASMNIEDLGERVYSAALSVPMSSTGYHGWYA